MSSDRPVLIYDCMNAFVRAYTAYPQMSSHGYQVGGTVGFLKTLRRLVSEIQPTAVYLAWEGGGSATRRKLFPEYKLRSKPEKLNRFYEDDIPDSEENKKHQLIALLGLVKNIPACQLYVSDCEGDDVIAHLCKNKLADRTRVIASSDKDFYQLLDDNTKIYSFHKKTYVTVPNVLETFRVTASNFALAKALCGDPSDNVPGIKGLGFKTVAKKFPFLGIDENVLLQDVYDYAASRRDESAIYKRVVDEWQDVVRNWKLVYLGSSTLSATQALTIDQLVGTFKPRANRMAFTKLLIKEGINDFDVEGFFYSFHCIEGIEY